MGTVVTVMNMKGGVGKTTVTMHIAGLAARFRFGTPPTPRTVLAIDYDPQFNLSQAFLAPKVYFALEEERKTTLSVLLDDDADLDPYQLQVPGNHTPPQPEDIVTPVIRMHGGKGALDLLPSTLDLMYVALGPANSATVRLRNDSQNLSRHAATNTTLSSLIAIRQALCLPRLPLVTPTTFLYPWCPSATRCAASD